MASEPWKPKMLPPVWVAVGIGLMFALHAWLPLAQWLHGWWRAWGLLPAVLGVALAVWGERQFARAGTGVIPGSEVTALVRTGPFRYTRNPMYVGMTLVLLGAALAFGSASVFVVPVLFVPLIHVRFVRNEEAMLKARFGEEQWRDYARSTRRWL